MEDSTYRLISLSGFFVISGIAWVTGTRTKIKIETIVGSIFLAWTLGALTFWFSGSRAALEWINDLLIALLSASQKGSIFLFGPLALSPGQTLADGSSSIGFVLAFQVFPSVIFFFGLDGRIILLGHHAKNSSIFLKSLLSDSFLIRSRISSRFGQFVCWN